MEINILLTLLDFKEHNYILISYSPVIIPDTESFECRSVPANVILRYSNEETEQERLTPNLELTFGVLLKRSLPSRGLSHPPRSCNANGIRLPLRREGFGWANVAGGDNIGH